MSEVTQTTPQTEQARKREVENLKTIIKRLQQTLENCVRVNELKVLETKLSQGQDLTVAPLVHRVGYEKAISAYKARLVNCQNRLAQIQVPNSPYKPL